MDAAQIYAMAKGFADSFYAAFDTNRSTLVNFYAMESCLSFEVQDGQQFIVGKEKINEKLMSLSFQKVQHAITTIDAQPTLDGGLIVVVVGQLQTFYLKQIDNSWYITNDIFRLGVHNF